VGGGELRRKKMAKKVEGNKKKPEIRKTRRNEKNKGRSTKGLKARATKIKGCVVNQHNKHQQRPGKTGAKKKILGNKRRKTGKNS